MVPVAQLYRHDVPNLPAPAGHDLFQLLWCPLDHPDHDYNPLPRAFWRRSTDITQPLIDIPQPTAADEYYLPTPCVVYPEQVVEHRHRDLLPPKLRDQITAWEDGDATYFFELSLAPGWKVGGFPHWADWDPEWARCADCDSPMAYLLTAASGEWAHEGPNWRPPEDPPDTPYDPTGITIGRGWGLNVFYCPASFDHPVIGIASV